MARKRKNKQQGQQQGQQGQQQGQQRQQETQGQATAAAAAAAAATGVEAGQAGGGSSAVVSSVVEGVGQVARDAVEGLIGETQALQQRIQQGSEVVQQTLQQGREAVQQQLAGMQMQPMLAEEEDPRDVVIRELRREVAAKAELERQVIQLYKELKEATGGVLKRGYLHKWRDREVSFAGRWGLRYFVLQGDGLLSYYTSEQDPHPLRSVNIRGCEIRYEGSKQSGNFFVFGVYLPGAGGAASDDEDGNSATEADGDVGDVVVRVSSQSRVDAEQWIEVLSVAAAGGADDVASSASGVSSDTAEFRAGNGDGSRAAAGDKQQRGDDRDDRIPPPTALQYSITTPLPAMSHGGCDDSSGSPSLGRPTRGPGPAGLHHPGLRRQMSAEEIGTMGILRLRHELFRKGVSGIRRPSDADADDASSSSSRNSSRSESVAEPESADRRRKPSDTESIALSLIRGHRESDAEKRKQERRARKKKQLEQRTVAAASSQTHHTVTKHHFDSTRYAASRPMHWSNQASPLSSDSVHQDYRGFINLGVIILVVTHFRLIMENIIKYGVLLRLPAASAVLDLHESPSLTGFLLLNVSLLLAYATEKIAATYRVPETAIFVVNLLNIISSLGIPLAIVWFLETSVIPGVIYTFSSVIVFAKLISYAHANHDLRRQKRLRDKNLKKANESKKGTRSPTPTPKKVLKTVASEEKNADRARLAAGGDNDEGSSKNRKRKNKKNKTHETNSSGTAASESEGVPTDRDAGKTKATPVPAPAPALAPAPATAPPLTAASQAGSAVVASAGGAAGAPHTMASLASSLKNLRQESVQNSENYTAYPQNLTILNMYFFTFAPTLCYQLNYPRTRRIRKRYIFAFVVRLLLTGGLFIFILEQYMIPGLEHTVPVLQRGDYVRVAERLLKLSIPSTYCWLLMFYGFFHLWLNLLAELLRFGDRGFYKNWWNCSNIETYWRLWNLPVHHWFVRHVYFPLLRRGVNKKTASLLIFLFSAIFHELLFAVPLHSFNFLAFWGMLAQAPLVFGTKAIERTLRRVAPGAEIFGNMLFWLCFCIFGQPAALILGYYDYYTRQQMQGQGGDAMVCNAPDC